MINDSARILREKQIAKENSILQDKVRKVDLKDLRDGVPYTVKLYQCGSCYNDAKCCNNSKLLNVNLPMLQTGTSGRLDQTYMIQGLSAAQLNGANIYLERDGGYKAGWGKLEK